MIYFILLFELFSFISSFSTMEECSLWAKEGECIKNPRYLWAHCLESCMEYAKDDHEQCNNWASIGECSKNPAYVQVHCPQSCGYSLNWNPYTRQSLHIEFLTYPFHDYVRFESNCYVITSQNNIEGANSLYIAGVTMHHRLSNLLKHASYYGFSRTSPSEFLLSYGIIEGMLYSIHLYEIVANASLQSRPSVYDNTPSIAQEFVKINLYPISDVKTKLYKSLTSDSDALTRTIFSNLELLDKAKDHLTILLNQTTIEYGGTNDVCLSGIGNVELNVSNVLPAYITSYHPTIEKNQPISSFYTLSNGIIMPSLGLGTWQLNGNLCEEIVFDAIQIGYRHIDTAQAYGNEKEVGNAILRALNEGIVKREDLWITSKLWNTYHAQEHVKPACQKSLSDMGIDYFDLYLIHFPISQKFVPFETRYPPEWIYDPNGENPRIELNPIPYSQTWAGMENLVDEGLVRNIGVANLVVQSLMDLLSYCRIKPVVNQVEIHPYLIQSELLEYSQISSIHLTAFSPLGSSSYIELNMDFGKNVGALQEPIIQELAQKYSKTPAQVILRWNLQRGVSIIPKSSSISRINENFNLFDFNLSQEEIERINSLNCNLRFNNPGVFCKFMGGSIPIFG
mmetsp:Transcript_3843/g.3810  ORF Transcript_3843/g.3810 Transcript_3843/m.3810 type:complete len:623 (+) Transcript_3843:21-1889(+)